MMVWRVISWNEAGEDEALGLYEIEGQALHRACAVLVEDPHHHWSDAWIEGDPAIREVYDLIGRGRYREALVAYAAAHPFTARVVVDQVEVVPGYPTPHQETELMLAALRRSAALGGSNERA